MNCTKIKGFFKHVKYLNQHHYRLASAYVQGQSPEPKIREYFYFVNHEGMVNAFSSLNTSRNVINGPFFSLQLFLDDARMKNFTSCFKDKKFLQFFFSRLKINDTNRYTVDFPYISLCGRERNFVRCDDLPIVFTHILPDPHSKKELLTYSYASDLLTVGFEPDKIYMAPSGKVYHPAPERYGSIGLIRSKLAIELSKHFEFEEGEEAAPNAIHWGTVKHKIDTTWVSKAVVFKPL